MLSSVLATQRIKVLDWFDQVMLKATQTLPVKDEYGFNRRQLILNFQVLVQLFLVFHKQKTSARVRQRVLHLASLVGRVNAIDHAAGQQNPNIGKQPFLAILALYRHHVAALQAQRQQTVADITCKFPVLLPTDALPDAELFFTHRDAGAAFGTFAQEHLWQCFAAIDGDGSHRQVFLFFQRRLPRIPCSFLPR